MWGLYVTQTYMHVNLDCCPVPYPSPESLLVLTLYESDRKFVCYQILTSGSAVYRTFQRRCGLTGSLT
jgi:hypothetical protein